MPDFINQPLSGDTARVPGQSPANIVRVGSPTSLLAAIPILLRFEPSAPSMVVIGTVPPRSEVALALRYDISDPRYAAALARHAAAILGAQRITTACAVGYGLGKLVTPVADALRTRFTAAGIAMPELLRVQDGRYWSYVCTNPECCPPEGTKFDLEAHPITRQHARLVLASREALAATVAPVSGETADSMRRATNAARRRAARIAAGAGQDGRAGRRLLWDLGLKAVADALALYRAGGEFQSHRNAAWLALSLLSLRVRDDAWCRMVPEHRDDHQRLWTDLATLARPGYAAAPATLLAYTAWQDGNGALANVALDRALSDDPDYSMAHLIRDALDAGAPPSLARLPMTPEDVADSYEQAERAEQAAHQADLEQPEEVSIPEREQGAAEVPGSGTENDRAAQAAALADSPA
jgi:hypothetical protein